MILVVELRMTCLSHPAQWEGLTRDGQVIYVRYRWGTLQVGVGATLHEAAGQYTIRKHLGDGYDGSLTYEELQSATRDEVSWPCAVDPSQHELSFFK